MQIPLRCYALLALLLGGTLNVAADVLYSLTELGTLGGFSSGGAAINNLGQVTGGSITATGQTHAFLYSNGQMMDLGTLGGFSGSFASEGFGINNLGQVTGEGYITPNAAPNALRAFLYSNGQMIDLGTLPGGFSAAGMGINDLGQVTGKADTAVGIHAFLYSNGQMMDLGTLPGFAGSFGQAINNRGEVTGFLPLTTAGFPGHAFLYSNGQMIDLGTLGGPTSMGLDINDLGQVTGNAYTAAGQQHAFLYGNGQMMDLGTLGGSTSNGVDINNLGQVVGDSSLVPGRLESHAFLYSNGQMIDLNNLIDPALGVTLWGASAINDQGQIVAGSPTGTFLLTPVPEPGTLASLGGALLVLIAAVYTRRRSALT